MGTRLFEEADKNRLISSLMLYTMLFLVALFPALAWILTEDFCITAILLAVMFFYAVQNFFYSFSTTMGVVGARKIAHGSERSQKEKQLLNIVEEMKIASGYGGNIDVYIIEDKSINAMAISRGNKAAIGATRGALEKLTREELSGVISHEMAHVVNADSDVKLTAFMTLGILYAYLRIFTRIRPTSNSRKGGAAVMYLLLAALSIFAYAAGILMFFALSRKRETLADVEGTRFTRNKEALISALKKIATNDAMQVPETASSLFFANPLSPLESKVMGLFATHPPLEERIRYLQSL
ncbi:MAG: M48 family metalloprotease [Candidatus Anstonellales archaeon]